MVANPLGSGVLENPGLMAYLPRIAKVLLGQDLRLASVPTWWCGDEQALAYVVDHIDQLVVKPVFPLPGTATVYGAQLSAQERDSLIQNIRARPHCFVGQEQVALSTTPVFIGDRLEPRPVVLRSFLVARDDGYVAMPGGLTRVAPDTDGWLVSGQAGGLSKDTWILASEPESQFSLIPAPEQAVSITRGGGEVPSRMADNLFWLGRYVERTAGGARVFREVLQRVLDTETARYDTSLSAFLSAHTHSTATYLRFIGYGEQRRLAVAEQELFATILDAARPGSLRFHLNALVRAGQAARDRLSDDAWRAINRLDRELAKPWPETPVRKGSKLDNSCSTRPWSTAVLRWPRTRRRPLFRIDRSWKPWPTSCSASIRSLPTNPTRQQSRRHSMKCSSIAAASVRILPMWLSAVCVPRALPRATSAAISKPLRRTAQLIGAAASHAWVSVYCPGQGWIDFDPTNNSIPTDQHITVAWGRDYSDVTPLKGVIVGGGSHTLDVAVTAERVP